MSALPRIEMPNLFWLTLSNLEQITLDSFFFSLCLCCIAASRKAAPDSVVTQILKLFTRYASVHSFFPFDLTKLVKLWIEEFERMFPLQDRVKMYERKGRSWEEKRQRALVESHTQTQKKFPFSACGTLRKLSHLEWDLKMLVCPQNIVNQACYFQLETANTISNSFQQS
jgi:hypothetical protein